MKKILLASALVAVMGVGAFSVYADSAPVNEYAQGYGHMNDNGFQRGRSNEDREIFSEEERQARFDERQGERSEYREERIQLALDEGWITEEEATDRRAEFAERDRLQEENGFNGKGFQHGGMRRGNTQSQIRGCH